MHLEGHWDRRVLQGFHDEVRLRLVDGAGAQGIYRVREMCLAAAGQAHHPLSPPPGDSETKRQLIRSQTIGPLSRGHPGGTRPGRVLRRAAGEHGDGVGLTSSDPSSQSLPAGNELQNVAVVERAHVGSVEPGSEYQARRLLGGPGARIVRPRDCSIEHVFESIDDHRQTGRNPEEGGHGTASAGCGGVERRVPRATPHWQRDTPNPAAVSGAGGCPQPPPPAPNRIPLESPS